MNKKITIKSSLKKDEHEYPVAKWVEKINNMVEKDPTINYKIAVLNSSAEVLKEVFFANAAKIIDFEKVNGKMLYFDVKTINDKLSIDECNYEVIYEYFSFDDVKNLELFNFELDINDFENISDTELDEIAKNYGYTSKDKFKKQELNDIIKWYKQDIFSRFFSSWAERIYESFDVDVSKEAHKKFQTNSAEKARIYGIEDNKELSTKIIKKHAIISKLIQKFDMPTTAEAKAVLKYADISIKANNMKFEEEDDKLAYLRDWLMSIVYGRKIIKDFFPDIFRKILFFK